MPTISYVLGSVVPEFVVNATAANDQFSPDVVMLGDGSLFFTFDTDSLSNAAFQDTMFRRFSAVGSALDAKLRTGEPIELSISQKTTAPIYNAASGEIEPGDPANPLGQHLLAIGGELALHGTNPRVSPQTPQPSGGIRMAAGDIAEVYDILTIGSRVIVRK